MTDNWAIGEQSTESRRWEGRTYTSVTLEQIDHQVAVDVFIGRINHVCARTAEHTSYVIPCWCIYIFFYSYRYQTGSVTGEGRLADPALEGRRSFIVTAQQDTSKLPLAAVSDSEEERSG